jgi:transposase InsO family protein
MSRRRAGTAGISCNCYYTWLRRYEAEGLDGLKDRLQQTALLAVGPPGRGGGKDHLAVPALPVGPAKIAMYLQRYHDVAVSKSGVWRILQRLGMNRLPASQRYKRHDRRWKRYEKQRPGHQFRVDVKFIEPPGQPGRKKKYYQFIAIDDCTRLASCAPAHAVTRRPRSSSSTTLVKLPFAVERVQKDNGQEFGASFHLHLLDKGSDHIYIRPRTPRLNGKVERSHRIDAESSTSSWEARLSTTPTSFSPELQE